MNLQDFIPRLIKLWRGGGSSSVLSPKEYERVSGALLRLQRGLTGDRKLAGAGYMQENDLLGAYLLYYWPVTFLQVHHAFETAVLSNEISFENEVSVLDLGCGPGPAGISFCNELKKQGVKKIHVTLADYSSKAVSLAKKLYESAFPETDVCEVIVDIEKKYNSIETVFNKKQGFDAIIISHALNELWKTQEDACQKRQIFILNIKKILKNDGILFLMEPALLKTSRSLIELRNSLIKEGFSVVSPCPSSEECPVIKAGENITCHGEYALKNVPLVTEIARRAKLDRNSVKMTYFMFKNGIVSREEKKGIYTVVSEGMLNKSGRIRFLLCDGNRRIACSAKKDDSHAAETGFFKLHRYEKIELINPEVRGDNKDSFGIGKETAVAHPLQQGKSHISDRKKV
ncbi:methyltransferase domain-containing protein [Treponema rectale]|uniref:Methyltransferase domain-containing protein n=1 Tax=Treponema rectale TaxID=744512 RepID=A0A840SGA2_9SPIR|nr:small ribosomal subunit Rsm22 family protein [Treponema rectale]MBB5218946.1 SAM-dependent methyltransferase [Treponema rectale]QOS41142.1 methyltransferase domain-containing protein [Treponema rectale]